MPSASQAQLNLIKTLASQRITALGANPAVATMPVDTVSQASALITVLKNLPVDPRPGNA